MDRLPRLAFALLICLSLAACGDDEPGDGGTNAPLTGGERLAWDQQAASVQELRALTYRLYIDGTLSAFIDVRCEETLTSAGYACSGGLPAMTPGRHTLQVSSVLNGVESARSEPLTIDVAGTTRRGAPASASPLSDSRSRAPATACIETSGDECYGITVVASGIGVAHTLRSTPDGRLLFIEDGARVRIVEGDRLLDEPALALEDPGSLVVGLAVDSQFIRTRSVYVAWTEDDETAGSVLNVTRYRELAGALGEGAQIVTGLPVNARSKEQDPAYVRKATEQDPPYVGTPMAVDGEGLLYVAMAASVDGRDSRAPSGALLRFTRDGLVPRGNPLASPIVSEGYARPAGLAIDVLLGRVWVTGHHPAWQHSVASLTPTSNTAFSTFSTSSTFSTFKSGSIALAQPAAPGEAGRLLIVASKDLYVGLPSPDGRLTSLRRVRFDVDTSVLDVAEGPNGSVYALTSTEDGASTLIKLTP